MTDRVISFGLPPVGPRHLPHGNVKFEFRVSETFPWEFLADVPPAEGQLSLPDVNPGVIFYKLTLYDTADQPCKNPSVVSKAAPYDPPGDLLNVTITDT